MIETFELTKSILGRCGPDKVKWNISDMWLEDVNAILSLNDANMVDKDEIKRLGIAYGQYELPPHLDDGIESAIFCFNQLSKITQFIHDHSDNGKIVVHCRAGKDRTAVALAAYLVKYVGYDPEQAMLCVQDARPNAFTGDGWDIYSERLLRMYSDSL